jgi:predicted permease
MTGLLFGIVPALCATRWSSAEALREVAAARLGSQRGNGAGRWLVSFQTALSLVLLFGAGLFLNSYWRLASGDHGFDDSHVLLIETGVRGSLNSEGSSMPQYSAILDALQAIPGVQSTAYSFTVPVGDSQAIMSLAVDGQGGQRQTGEVWENAVSPGYFKTFGTSLIAGRDLDSQDDRGRGIVVNEAFGRKFFGDANALGKTVRIQGPTESSPTEIIGVVQDTKYDSLRQPVPPTVYDPVPPKMFPGGVIAVRTEGPPSASIPAVVETIRRVDKNLAITVRTFESLVDDSLVKERLLATLSAFFGALALLIAAVGLAGLVSSSVTRRRAEIGVRAALGATSGSLIRLVMRDVVLMTTSGLIAGTATGVAAARGIATMLYEVRPSDPATIVAAGLTLAIVAFVAGYIPARRAARVDPMECLRLQ